MAKKKLQMNVAYNSIFYDAKWLGYIHIHNFNSRKVSSNKRLLDKIQELVVNYNKEK